MPAIEALAIALPGRRPRWRWRACAARLPVFTILLSAIAVIFQFSPGLGESMCFDREAVAAGQPWRLLTGHFTHSSADHLFWDVSMFAILGALIERRDRRRSVATVVASAALISLALWFGEAGVDQYRGLSGIDSALFTLAALVMLDDARRANQPIVVWGLVALVAGFALKLLWELTTGRALFVDSAQAGFVPLPLVHAVGGFAGAIVWLATRRPRPEHTLRPAPR